MTFTVEVEADGRIKLPAEAQQRLARGEEIHLQREDEDRSSHRLLVSYEDDERLETRNGWPVLVGGETFRSQDTLDAISRSRRERMEEAAGPGFSASDFE